MRIPYAIIGGIAQPSKVRKLARSRTFGLFLPTYRAWRSNADPLDSRRGLSRQKRAGRMVQLCPKLLTPWDYGHGGGGLR